MTSDSRNLSQAQEPQTDQAAGKSHRVLIVDDDREFCELISDYLDPQGYDVGVANNGVDGVAKAFDEPWHAVVLDVMMPGLGGFEALREIRRRSNVPVMMLTSRGEEIDRIVGLEMGADDYLPKTFSTREFLARLRALIRRSGMSGSSTSNMGAKNDGVIAINGLEILTASRSATVDGQELQLTPLEYDLLVAMARAEGRVLSRDQLLDQVRGTEAEVFDRAIDVHVSSLRKKLGDNAKEPRFIRTVRGAGYLLIPNQKRDEASSHAA